jgi:hypothetical protein
MIDTNYKHKVDNKSIIGFATDANVWHIDNENNIPQLPMIRKNIGESTDYEK